MKGTPHAIYKFLAGLTVGLILSTPARADVDCSKLPPIYQARIVQCLDALVKTRNPGVTQEDLGPDAVELFMQGYNASPPASRAIADVVRIFSKPGSGKHFVIVGFAGRTVDALEAPKSVVNTWRAGKPWVDPNNSL